MGHRSSRGVEAVIAQIKGLGFGQTAFRTVGEANVFLLGKIAERNIMQAQTRLEQSFQQQQEAFLEFQQQSIPEIMPILEPKPMIQTGFFCPIFGNTNEGV